MCLVHILIQIQSAGFGDFDDTVGNRAGPHAVQSANVGCLQPTTQNFRFLLPLKGGIREKRCAQNIKNTVFSTGNGVFYIFKKVYVFEAACNL
jgi:hypothetical protein